MRATMPLPMDRADLAPSYLKARGTNIDKWYPGSPNGAGMYPRPPGYHGGWDIFAPKDTPVYAPFDGRTVHRSESRGTSGSVYGGVIGVESNTGPAVIFRHVVPEVPEGAPIRAGERIARVSPWSSGSPHAHMECYRYWPASYNIANAVDPGSWDWVPWIGETPTVDYFIEDMPHNQGGTGPVIVRRTGSLAVAKSNAAKQRALGRLTSIMLDARDGAYCVMWWLPGTHRNGLPVFGPWGNETIAKATLAKREQNRNSKCRLFIGRENSIYPRGSK